MKQLPVILIINSSNLNHKECQTSYEVKKPGNGVYAFMLEGSATIAGQPLSPRDGLGIRDAETFDVEASADAKILLMEVPMN